MTDPVRVIADSVRTRARRGALGGPPEQAVREELRSYAEHAFAADVPLIADERRAEREVVADLVGFGPLQPLLDDPSVEEVWINAPTP
jgi:pilus assembly protein CpaF